MRRFSILLAAVLSVTAFPPSASPVAPVMERTFSGPFVLSTEFCDFASIIVSPRHDKLRIFTFSDGRRIITSSYLATAFDSVNEKLLKLNLSGQARVQPTADGGRTITRTGTNLLARPGSVLLVHGPIVVELDADNNLIDITIVGHVVTDLCEFFRDP
jgi:hypothetical protein